MRVLLLCLLCSPLLASASTWRDGRPRTVVAELFGWNWKSVARECTEVLGPAGYRAVKVMPATEHVSDGHWWARYQPVSYQLQSWSGTRAEFAAMVAACRAAGLQVEVDVIINHMANGVGTGSAGNAYSVDGLSYPGVPYGSGDFHPPCRMLGADISSYTRCWLGRKPGDNGLPDLDTGKPWVQQRIGAHLSELQQLGVERLYVDAAKHIDVLELEQMLGSVPGMQVAQEVWTDAVGPAPQWQKNYLRLGLVSEFNYARVLRTSFKSLSGRSLAALNDFLNSPDRVASAGALVFVTNHDLERTACTSTLTGGDCATLTVLQPELYFPANAFMLAHPYGTPYVYSSYYFAESGDGPPLPPWQEHDSHPSGCSSEVRHGRWNCSHRDARMLNMVAFRNYTDGSPLLDWQADGAQRVAFRRGNAGFAAFNNTDGWWQRSFDTGLPDGSYCNAWLPSTSPDGSCPLQHAVAVSGGRISLSIAPRAVLALHLGARPRCDDADDFDLPPVTDAPPGSWQETPARLITGLGCAATVSMTQGEFRIDDGPWQSQPATISNGQTLRVRLQAPPAGGVAQARVQLGVDVMVFSVSSQQDVCTAVPVCTLPAPPRAAEPVTLVYRGPLGASQSLSLHWGLNGWQHIQTTPMQRASDGSWRVQLPVPSWAWELDFVFTDGYQWDNNGWQDWRLAVQPQAGPGPAAGAPALR